MLVSVALTKGLVLHATQRVEETIYQGAGLNHFDDLVRLTVAHELDTCRKRPPSQSRDERRLSRCACSSLGVHRCRPTALRLEIESLMIDLDARFERSAVQLPALV